MPFIAGLEGVAVGIMEGVEVGYWVVNGDLLVQEFESKGVKVEDTVSTFEDNGRVYAVTRITTDSLKKHLHWAADYLRNKLRDYAPTQVGKCETFYIAHQTDVLSIRLGEECRDMIDVTPWIEKHCPEVTMRWSSKVFYENVHGDYYVIIRQGSPSENGDEVGHLIVLT